MQLLNRLIIVTSCFFSLTLSCTAFGQAQNNEPRAETVIEEVIVTARKREERLQDTPISVTAIVADTLDVAGTTELTDIDDLTPNLHFTIGQGGGSNTVNAFIRGVGETDFIITTDPAVGLYIDGIYIARAFGSNIELADIERVEVLRGPQGTLFGKNSIGGAINVITRKPQGDNSYSIKGSIGNHSYQALRGSLDIPLSEELSLGVSLLTKQADGWQKRPQDDAADEDQQAARLAFNWQPSDNFLAHFVVDWAEHDQNGYANVLLTSFMSGDTGTASFFYNLWNTVNPDTPCCTPNNDIDKSNAGGDLPNDEGTHKGVSLLLQYNFADLELKSITGWRKQESLFGRDGDNGTFNYNGDVHDEEHDQLSQELQISGSSMDDRLDWLAGIYYFNEDSQDDTDLIIGVDVVVPNVGSFPQSVRYNNEQETSSYAGFFHLSYALNEQTHLIAGARYTSEEKTFKQKISTILNDGTTSPRFFSDAGPMAGLPAASCDYDPSQPTFNCDQDWSEFSPKLGVQYQPHEKLNVYAHYSRGFRSGGFNGRPFQSAKDLQEYDPEVLSSYEIGFKKTFENNKLRINGSFFYNDYEDIQLLIVQNGFVAIENASKASILGFEMELQAVVSANLQFNASVGFLDDDSDGFTSLIGDFTDTELKHTPEWNIHLEADYTQDFLGGEVRLWLGITYTDEYFIDAANTPILHTGGHTLYDANISWTNPDRSWSIALQGKNLGDKRILNSGFDGLGFFGYIEGSYNEPRRYYLTLSYFH